MPGRDDDVLRIPHFARQSALLISSGVVSYAGSFALYVLLANRLGDSGLGAFAVALGMAQTLAVTGQMGADWVVTRQGSYFHSMGDEARLRRVIHLAFLLCGVGTGTLAGFLAQFAPVVAGELLGDPSTASLLRVAAVMVVVTGIGQMALAATQAFKSMREAALVRNLLQPLLRLAFVIAALSLARSEFVAFLGVVASEVVLTTVSLFALRRRIRLLGPTTAVGLRGAIGFALPAWGYKVVEQSRSQLFPVLVASLSTLAATGVFVASSRLAVAPIAILTTLNQVYRPVGSSLFLQHRRDELGALFKDIAKLGLVLGLPFFLLQAAFPRDLLALFGASFEEAHAALVLLAIAMLFNFATGPAATSLMISGRARLSFVDGLGVLVIEVALGLWLVPLYGLIGAAIAKLVGEAVNNLVRLAQVWMLEGMHPFRGDYWKPAAAGAIAVAIALSTVAWSGLSPGVSSAALAASVLGVGYAGLVLLLGLSPGERAALDALLRRRAIH